MLNKSTISALVCKLIMLMRFGSIFRPGADDVLVLRKELVHAQTIMDELTQEQEKEKNKLLEDYQQLQVEHQT